MTINHTRTVLHKSYKYKPGGCGFDSRMRRLYFFIALILPVSLWPWIRLGF
jgi:hypothetical protein